jgi:hypothetical protein
MTHFLWGGWVEVRLIFATYLAGALNAVAGGGSFLSFPALLSVGILPIQANATNSVAVWPGQLTSIAAYREELRHHHHLLIPLGLAAFVGGMLGAIVLLRTAQDTFMALVPWLLLSAALLFAASGPVQRWLARRSASQIKRKPAILPMVLGITVVCFYIGYFGAGAGFLIITVLALFGFEDMNHINSVKVFCTTCSNGVAVTTFIVRGYVDWKYCIPMMIAGAIGGYMAARIGRRLPQAFLRGIVVAIGLTMAAYFFWRQHHP